MNQKYSHAHDAVSVVDRLPLLVMIAVSVGFGLFPMHLYDVVRSGVDPLVARITQVVPVAETDGGSGVIGEMTTPGKPSSIPMAAVDRLTPALYPSRGRE